MTTERLATLADIGKQYVKYEDTPTLVTGIRRTLGRRGRRRRIWAVRHVDLEIDRGDAIGIIGRNGSGKSTTLAMLAGITAPTEGTLRVRGRIAPLLKLGVGFHPELTGRENVYINGLMLGMSRRDIDAKFEELVAFSEVGDFIDTPVKFYSTGMQVRLGFASAISTRPDLLLVDEVLSVGDVGFQVKSFDRMQRLREDGTTLLFVSHNLNAIRRLSEKVLVLHDGEPRFLGRPDEAINLYHELLQAAAHRDAERDRAAPCYIKDVELLGADGDPTAYLESGDEMVLRMRTRFTEDVPDPIFAMSVITEGGQLVYTDNSVLSGTHRPAGAGEEVVCDMRFRVPLVRGTYSANTWVRWGDAFEQFVRAPDTSFYVAGRSSIRGVTDLGASFELT